MIWNLESYLSSEITVKQTELRGEDPLQVFLQSVSMDGATFQNLIVAYMNETNVDNYAQAKEMARAHANMLGWT